MTAFAQPLLTTRARARPAVCSRTALETVTGAAWNALRVKVAAVDVGRDDVERRMARSRIEASFFTPLCMPPRRYPRGKRSSGIGLWRCALDEAVLAVNVDVVEASRLNAGGCAMMLSTVIHSDSVTKSYGL